ncbi:MAG: TolC family outer membrane protein [Rhodobacteraceae bacterium]|nr:TolC family outer membrane protein [Paracoccaceae bacterium]
MAVPAMASAETIKEALALAYANNPTLNAARAQLRATDEGVPQALSGWRPTVSGSGTAGGTHSSSNGNSSYRNNASISLSISQPLFRGFRTVNSTKQAEALVQAQRASLAATEQDILLSAAQSYVDVIRDTALVALSRSDLNFLQEQVRAARDRFDVGEGTRTDVSQADARRAEAVARLNTAIANLNTSRAIYRQIVGQDPERLSADTSIKVIVPRSLDVALSKSESNQPLIVQALHNVDAADYNAKVVTGNLLPTVSLEGSASRSWTTNTSSDVTNSASVLGRVNIPIFQGGVVHSQVRQAKEQLGQARLVLDATRNQVRANVISAWGVYQAAEASISAATSAVQAQQLALDGVIEEQRVGQQTTLDVLDAQRELVTQRSNLVTAQRNLIVGGYQLVAAIGDLDAESLGLAVAQYNPERHYKAVRDKWIGLRSPSE